MDNKKERASFAEWFEKNKWTIIVLLLCMIVFLGFLIYAGSGEEEDNGERASYTLYERGEILAIVEEDVTTENSVEDMPVGRQTVTALVNSGEFEGRELEAGNYIGSLYGTVLAEGDKVVLCISVVDGEVNNVTVYEYDKTIAAIVMVGLFIVATVLVGRRRGLQPLLGLILTIVALIWILLPLLLKGFPTVITTLLLCVFLTLICFTLLGGITKKTVCAMLGTTGGLIIAVLFAFLGQSLCRINGLRMGQYIDALLQLKMGGSPLQISGLLMASTIISALGAVMDVAMSISSSANELIAVNPSLTRKDLWKSGMNIGRDMIGTMTNTLILAFVGSSLVMVLYLSTTGISFYELFSSSVIATELIHAVASSIGVILAVPLTVGISMALYRKK